MQGRDFQDQRNKFSAVSRGSQGSKASRSARPPRYRFNMCRCCASLASSGPQGGPKAPSVFPIFWKVRWKVLNKVKCAPCASVTTLACGWAQQPCSIACIKGNAMATTVVKGHGREGTTGGGGAGGGCGCGPASSASTSWNHASLSLPSSRGLTSRIESSSSTAKSG